MDNRGNLLDNPLERSDGATIETPKASDAQKRKREQLERELHELKQQIARVEEKKQHMGVPQESPRPDSHQPTPEGVSDPETTAKRSRSLAPPFKPRLMLTKTSGGNRVWNTNGRASPSPLSADPPDRFIPSDAAVASGAAVPPMLVPRPASAEPQASTVLTPGSTIGTPLSREVSPFSEGVPEGAEEGDGQGAAKRKRYPSTKGVEVGRPSWLPEGWRVEEKVRGQGATAGTKDKYYFSPEGKRFRSRAEIQRFIDSGALPAVPRKKKEGDNSAPNSRPGTPVGPPRPFDATPEDIQRLLSGASAGPSHQPSVPKIPSRSKASVPSLIAPGIPPLTAGSNPHFDSGLGPLPQGFPGQWPSLMPMGKEVPQWQQPLSFSTGVMPHYPGQQFRQSHLGPQQSVVDPFGRGGAFPMWQGSDASQAFGARGANLLDLRRAPVKQKVKKVKVPRRRLLVADRFHLESLGKRLVKERLASLLQEGMRQRQGEIASFDGARLEGPSQALR